jgi:hypothetical protein
LPRQNIAGQGGDDRQQSTSRQTLTGRSDPSRGSIDAADFGGRIPCSHSKPPQGGQFVSCKVSPDTLY